MDCVKSVQISSFFWSVFSGIRAEYGEIPVFLHIQSECEKIRTRKNSVFGHFSPSDGFFSLVRVTNDLHFSLEKTFFTHKFLFLKK